MPQAIYINLPVADLGRSRQFFTRLGFTVDERLSGDGTTGLAISDSIHVMLHPRESLRRFARKALADGGAAAEVHLALRVESRENVDLLLQKALAAGAREGQEPQDLGFIYGRAFEDPDGHIWEVFALDEDRIPGPLTIPADRQRDAAPTGTFNSRITLR